MPNYGFKTVTLREDVYAHLKRKSETEGLTVARFVTRLVREASSDEEANAVGVYQRAYSVPR
jgi:hypothetical protein